MDDDALVRDFCVDVLSRRSHEPLLSKLFQQPPGAWMPLGPAALECGIQTPPGTDLTNIYVTWLVPPDAGDQMPVVLFFSAGDFWSMTAVHRKVEGQDSR